MGTPGPDVLDAELHRLRAAAGALSSALDELETEPAWTLLHTTSPSGTTAQRWQDATASLTELWAGHRLLSRLLDDAQAVRAQAGPKPDRTARQALAGQLFESSVEVSPSALPRTAGALPAGADAAATITSGAARHCRPAELLAALDTPYGTVRALLGDLGAAWRWQLDRVEQCRAELTQLQQDGAQGRELAQAESVLRVLSERVRADPLAVEAIDFAPVWVALERARGATVTAPQAREQAGDTLAKGPALLAELARLQAAATSAHAVTVVKIAQHPPAPPAGADVAALQARFTQLGAAVAADGLTASATALRSWRREMDAALAAADAGLAAQDRPMAQRAELRGRLDAYKAKAHAHGLAEHPQLGRMGSRARDLLFRAPCALDEASAAVSAYTNAVTAAIQRPDPEDRR